MQQMASRPFATINVALETEEEPPDLIGGNVKVSRSPDTHLSADRRPRPSGGGHVLLPVERWIWWEV